MHYYTSFPEILQRISVHYFLVCLDIFHIVFYQKIVERYTIFGRSFKYTSTFHEIGHCIDRAGGNLSYKDAKFKDDLQNDFDTLVDSYMKLYNMDQEKSYSEIGKGLQEHKYHSISDIAGGLTRNKCVGKYRHDDKYWERDHALEKEAFAHFFEAYARNDAEKIEAIPQVFPNAAYEFMKLLE